MEEWDLVVIGAGAGGLAAAIYGARAGLRTLVLEAATAGGLTAIAPLVENYPGFKAIKGIELMDKMKDHALHTGAAIHELEPVSKIDAENMMVTTPNNQYKARAIILATGSEHKKLGIPGEEEYFGKGVSQCATCDGGLFKGKKVAVIGGGNTAAIEALYLVSLAREVHLVHRRNQMRAEKALQEDLMKSGVTFHWDTIATEIEGKNDVVSRLQLKNVKNNEESKLRVKGVFIAVGEEPQSALAKEAGIIVDNKGFIIVDKNMMTNKPGIYAVGDLKGGVLQTCVAVGDGATAAVNAYLYIKGGWYGKGEIGKEETS
ncbi:MAG: NAD(P)/FAD-dependent oxidoreductase [Candidatus Hodarchaeota archaeon]